MSLLVRKKSNPIKTSLFSFVKILDLAGNLKGSNYDEEELNTEDIKESIQSRMDELLEWASASLPTFYTKPKRLTSIKLSDNVISFLKESGKNKRRLVLSAKELGSKNIADIARIVMRRDNVKVAGITKNPKKKIGIAILAHRHGKRKESRYT
ncbi:MAG: hypothetical protein GTO45_39275 [Candidatus Aminicenantes bacterium]|nr:hypothetical protein [Candidatus Aminicenantes bacterium]NIM84671.1 hypothetical protein [Candidatus Aminicenantes bacterium]NIN24170.1 hypothetical protein [Candidatus Aminicenantes bacterium]NIN47895.1 hypothetical protein [Candidatus Aminicenantes bacterium]NIN90833.1 hypothetical protein [Candidatus Aminicenantes bacterium]